jgi:serine/threonine protein phosphatase PrpC
VSADGVTLNFKKYIENGLKYPSPSPAGEVSKIFCEAVLKVTKNKYASLKESTIKEIFCDANDAVAQYNQKIGKTEFSGNMTGYYSATGSFMIIKGGKCYWASICDAYFAHFDKDMNKKFKSTGLCSRYAVINGEREMVEHIESGVVDIESGDRLFVFTDGFENYMNDIEFLELFKNDVSGLKNKISEFSLRKNQEDPEKFGHERSVVAVAV